MLLNQRRHYRLTKIFINRKAFDSKRPKFKFNKNSEKSLYVGQRQKVRQRRKIF